MLSVSLTFVCVLRSPSRRHLPRLCVPQARRNPSRRMVLRLLRQAVDQIQDQHSYRPPSLVRTACSTIPEEPTKWQGLSTRNLAPDGLPILKVDDDREHHRESAQRRATLLSISQTTWFPCHTSNSSLRRDSAFVSAHESHHRCDECHEHRRDEERHRQTCGSGDDGKGEPAADLPEGLGLVEQ
jgi:hypothetical protein